VVEVRKKVESWIKMHECKSRSPYYLFTNLCVLLCFEICQRIRVLLSICIVFDSSILSERELIL